MLLPFFFLFLLCFGLADLIAGGLSGEIDSHRPGRTYAGRYTGGILGLIPVILLVLDRVPPLLQGLHPMAYGVLFVLGLRYWLFLRRDLGKRKGLKKGSSSLDAKKALGVLFLVGLVAISLDLSLDSQLYQPKSLFFFLADLRAYRAFTLICSLVFLMGTGNGIVRAILVAAGTSFQGEKEGFRGGRYIGMLERWMILILAFSGNLTAAVIVVSAKSILRFPELNRAADRESSENPTEERRDEALENRETEEEQVKSLSVDVLTEYFLLGSLASWILPMVLIGLLPL